MFLHMTYSPLFTALELIWPFGWTCLMEENILLEKMSFQRIGGYAL